jgi:N-acetylneuraminic acid mutarotase
MRNGSSPRLQLAFLVVSLTLCANVAVAQVSPKRPMPTPRMAAAAAVVNGKIYVLGGVSKQGGMVATVEEYDPTKDAWRARSPMPTARAMLAAVAAGDRILSSVEVYDVEKDKWSTAAPLPQGRWGLMATEFDGKVYAFGGIVGTGSARQCVSAADLYDIATGKWTSGKPLPVAIQSSAMAKYEGQVFLMGGRAGAGDTGKATGSVYVYRFATSEWTSGPALPEARTGAGAGAIGSKLILVSGAASGRLSSNVDTFDIPSQKWSVAVATLSSPRTGHVAAVVGGALYVIGGAFEESLAGITGLVEQVTVK